MFRASPLPWRSWRSGAAPDVNLGWFVAGVSALDLVWPLFVLAGLEHVSIVPGATAFMPLVFDSYPWSHSLAMTAIWGLMLVTIARAAKVPSSVGVSPSPWWSATGGLDFLTHAPDMPLWPGSPHRRFGLGRNATPFHSTLLVEGALGVVGIAVFLKVRRGERGRVAFWSLVAISTPTWATGPWSPPPPSERALGLVRPHWLDHRAVGRAGGSACSPQPWSTATVPNRIARAGSPSCSLRRSSPATVASIRPRWTLSVTVVPIDVEEGIRLCLAVDPDDRRGVWAWMPGVDKGVMEPIVPVPALFQPEGASVSTQGSGSSGPGVQAGMGPGIRRP